MRFRTRLSSVVVSGRGATTAPSAIIFSGPEDCRAPLPGQGRAGQRRSPTEYRRGGPRARPFCFWGTYLKSGICNLKFSRQRVPRERSKISNMRSRIPRQREAGGGPCARPFHLHLPRPAHTRQLDCYLRYAGLQWRLRDAGKALRGRWCSIPRCCMGEN